MLYLKITIKFSLYFKAFPFKGIFLAFLPNEKFPIWKFKAREVRFPVLISLWRKKPFYRQRLNSRFAADVIRNYLKIHIKFYNNDSFFVYSYWLKLWCIFFFVNTNNSCNNNYIHCYDFSWCQLKEQSEVTFNFGKSKIHECTDECIKNNNQRS